ncbi:hypothetical protein FGO68_gene12762 [Halteria grandinella]|uniref:Uncharacterized protein n=1 Tax=Halteria grandinella TaxID=5974 RepID=A0A8J8NYY5_HALGN|nr:hypothetical protein FGO68_gene12762 [Halteria grandinella]
MHLDLQIRHLKGRRTSIFSTARSSFGHREAENQQSQVAVSLLLPIKGSDTGVSSVFSLNRLSGSQQRVQTCSIGKDVKPIRSRARGPSTENSILIPSDLGSSRALLNQSEKSEQKQHRRTQRAYPASYKHQS